MTTDTAASLVNLLGFITGVVLYAMLLWLVLISRRELNRLALLTGFLGFAWNAAAFAGYGLVNLGIAHSPPLLLATAFGALCFLPSVVVHSALTVSEKVTRRANLLIAIPAYTMSAIATFMHVYSAMTTGMAPSQIALRGVTVGFAGLIIALLIVTRGQENRARILWVVAMSVFAVSALHLSYHQGNDPWWMQLAGHHASLPLVLLILYQDFRFALADIFLKRALAFMLLAGLTFGVFAFIVGPRFQSKPMNEQSTALVLTLWVATALAYPFLRRSAGWFVDNVVLKRVDYMELGVKLGHEIDRCESPRAVLDQSTRILSPALSAGSMQWLESTSDESTLWVQQDRRSARVTIHTSEHPHYVLHIRDLAGGRRLLSDDIAMLERAALLVARRIDAVRSMQERYRHDVREQEMRKLAAEAELRALRAQVNPHFLFNALTTIGYLIQTAPERALGTLMRLSGLLRGVLRSSDEFVALGEELDLIEAYLDIERARFEDRLRVRIEVPSELRRLRIPALVIQPLVENAIKHGISKCIAGGEVRISVHVEQDLAVIAVVDTGGGFTTASLKRRGSRGLGLYNVEQRLKRYGVLTPLTILSAPETGTTVEIRVPLQPTAAVPQAAGKPILMSHVADKLRVAIADDERPARSFLTSILRTFDDVEIVGEAINGLAAVAVIESSRPDLALLDLQMPEVDGIGVVRLLKKNKTPLVAFVTAYDEYAVRAFELNAVDYILKPVEPARLRQTIDRARDRLERQEVQAQETENLHAAASDYEAAGEQTPLQRIPVRRQDEIVLVPVQHVVSVVADGELLHLKTTENETHTICYRLRDLAARIDPVRFVRLSRGTLVNVEMIRRIIPLPGGTFTVVLNNSEEFRVSRLQSRLLREQILRL